MICLCVCVGGGGEIRPGSKQSSNGEHFKEDHARVFP